MKRDYVKNSDYVQAEYVLYNDLDKKLLPGMPEDVIPVDDEEVEKILIEGEEYVRLDLNYSDYILTNYGRVYNLANKRFVLVLFSNTNLHLYLRGEKLNFIEVFEDKGWDYDIEFIAKKHRENNWELREASNFRF